MTKFILVRHGQSKANECHCLVGGTESPLSSLGERQARAVSQYILKRYKIDAIYSSPLSRACDTIKGVADELHLPIQKEQALSEINFGKWEGLSLEKIRNSFEIGYDEWAKDSGAVTPEGGESMAELQKRVMDKLKEIGAREDGKTVLIGSHSTVIRAIQCYVQKLPIELVKNIPGMANASLSEINFDGENFYIHKMGFDSHLMNLD